MKTRICIVEDDEPTRQILTREMIESHIWNYDFMRASNVVDVYVRRLRRQLDDPSAEPLIETVRGVGYRLRAPRS